MYVRDFMTENPTVFSPAEDIAAAFSILSDKRIRQAPVVEDGNLVGIVTDRDLRMALIETNVAPGITVQNIMTPNPTVVREDSTIAEAGDIMTGKKFNAVPVVSKDGKLTGIITTTDILKGVLHIIKDPELCVQLITK